MTRLLAIETSGEACSVALSINGDVRHRHVLAPLKHAELLLPSIRDLMGEAGCGLNSLDAIVFGRGPGSFTSLRIGIGVVQGLAWGAELPVVPVSSLAAVAQNLLTSNLSGQPNPERILVAVDARMQEVFHCCYAVGDSGCLTELTEEAVSAPAILELPGEGTCIAAGNGFERYPELTSLCDGSGQALSGVYADTGPSAIALLQLANRWLMDNKSLPAEQAQPVYVRNNVAEKTASRA